ncbi:hypothetical protein HY213_02410 [Candidatus Peregrinibacteria bacterium]|nr:hypothetical protein [Candidatus Peregrinibacteria bacterium]
MPTNNKTTAILFCAIIVILFATAVFEMQALRASTAVLRATGREAQRK